MIKLIPAIMLETTSVLKIINMTMTTEEKRAYKAAYMREYRAQGRESFQTIKTKREYNKKFYYENKQRAKDYYKKYTDNKKDGYHRVYLLEDYNYVGLTNSIYHRFINHKSKENRDCSNHRILYKTKDRSEALELEALLHDMGYEGKSKRYN